MATRTASSELNEEKLHVRFSRKGAAMSHLLLCIQLHYFTDGMLSNLKRAQFGRLFLWVIYCAITAPIHKCQIITGAGETHKNHAFELTGGC